MRSRTNENPVVQAALIGVLVLVFGFILFTRVMGGGQRASPTDAGRERPRRAPAPRDRRRRDRLRADGRRRPQRRRPGRQPRPRPPESESTGPLEAGEGMPAAVVEAYDANKVVVLLVIDSDAIDDKRVEEATKDLEGRSDVALFQTEVKNVADYSQITNGVGINRTPALIVMPPRRRQRDVPVATVCYGFRSLESVNQAVEDAKYDGKKAPYYPE